MSTSEILIESKTTRDGQLTQVKMEIALEVALQLATSRIRQMSCHQKKVLQALYLKPGICNKEVARLCFISERSVSGPLNDLEVMGVVQKTTDARDKRKSVWRICDREIFDAMTLNDRRPVNK